MPTKQNKKKPQHQTKQHAHKDDVKPASAHEETEEQVDSLDQDNHIDSVTLDGSAEQSEEETSGASRSTHSESHSSKEESMHAKQDNDADEESEEVKLDFPYSELVRSYAPKAMDVAEKVATDWKKDGSFMNLGIDNPYANMAVSMGLKKAKELEKKLDEKGVLSVVRMGVEVLKQQVNKKK